MKHKKKILILLIFIIFLIWWCVSCSMTAYYEPEWKKEDISKVIEKDKLSEKDYSFLFKQTGLSKLAIDDLMNSGEKEKIKVFAEQYFEKPDYEKEYLFFPIVAYEKNNNAIEFAPLKRGDIVVSLSTNTLGLRHGHAAIVVNGETGRIIEHMVLGEVSTYSYMFAWKHYSNVAVLRHKNREIAEKAAKYAENHLVGIPYNPLAGIIKKDKSDEKNISSSHCSHLVWQAFYAVGEDIDGDGGPIAFPADFLECDELELVQIYGINPER